MFHIQQKYYLELPKAAGTFSVLNFTVEEELGLPFKIEVFATTEDLGKKDLSAILHKDASFSIEGLGFKREWKGIVRIAGTRRKSNDEVLYRFVIEAKLAKLSDSSHCRLFQNKSVPGIVEDMLRHNGLGGSDFTFNLSDEYEAREYTTQYNERDFDFIRRLLEDEGIWWRYEKGEKIIFGDSPNQYVRASLDNIFFRPDQGLESGLETVSVFKVKGVLALAAVTLNDYNYRTAETSLVSKSTEKKPGLEGELYRWGSHHKTPAEGVRRAKILHEQSLCRRITGRGRGNVLALEPGLIFDLDEKQPEAENGWLLTKVIHQGGRGQSYENGFECIPAQENFRLLEQAPRPKVKGTLPARVVSPGAYDYAFLDEMGRYRVRLPFDLDSWSPGGDSRPVRLAKPFAGDNFGFHFPLHEGTEVMLAFVDGDPDRPFIAGAMHDSLGPDHVPDTWNTRNVIRTWANNKLRMEDKKGEEHIKLATEFQKTQLNMGHLVDSSRTKRGEGFELRSDGWGALRAAKGLMLSTQKRDPSTKQRDMDEALSQLKTAAQIFKTHAELLSEGTSSVPPDFEAFKELAEKIDDLKSPALLLDSAADLAMTTPQHILLRANNNIGISADGQIDFMSLKDITLKAIESVSLFAYEEGLKLVAAGGDVELEAHDTDILLASKGDLNIISEGGKVLITAKEELKLNCGGGAYILIKEDGSIEFGGSGPVVFECASYQQMGPDSKPANLPGFNICPGVSQTAKQKRSGTIEL